ncbi:aldehyde dehydrogenase family protein [Desulfogranum marinum]|uniref:aldehyde dehydrogenase family protein n=1 Tax=Desulfogranum marinum TaxID=453220 RepID=UPI0029C782D7|nr:aldehyde dehydrogenase family protein [Desulfogranum marinum]
MTPMLQSFDPFTGELIDEVAITSPAQLQHTVAASHDAAKQWQALTPEKRLHHIHAAYAAAEPEMETLAELLSREMGKDIRRSTGEVHGTVMGGPYIAEAALQALQPQHLNGSTLEYRPLGTVAVISPWNYPLAMANNLIIPALIAGNCVIWKPSEETPLVAQTFFDLIKKELPPHVLQLIHGTGEQGRMLVESDVDMIAFTGSQIVGKDIMQRTGKDLKRLVMELGGNDPMIVLHDANLDAAARFAVASSFENAGQMCTSTERIYVDAAIADIFEQKVVEYAKHYKVGPWNLAGVNIGPIINHGQHQKILEHIQEAVEKNCRLLHGSVDQKPPFITPTVLADLTPEMRIMREETFGPVVCISRFTNLDEAIHQANDTSYGLGAVVFGNKDAQHVADQFEAGMIGINQGVGGGGDAPWVGAKQSGFGFHGSPEGHRQFAQTTVINK